MTGRSVFRLVRNNPFVRKSLALLRQASRARVRLGATAEDYLRQPPVLANSVPKSGTHLLLQVLQGLPATTHYGSFIASTPPLTFYERSERNHLRLIRALAPGEICPAHLFYADSFDVALDRLNCVHYFIYRDPRDVVVSDAHYLAEMTWWHRMHKYFKQIEDPAERISRAILGFKSSNADFPYDYPDVARRFSRYLGWLNKTNVFAIRYEDLIGVNLKALLENIAVHYFERSTQRHSVEETVAAMLANINPEKSHTFREGKAGGWKKVFTEQHKSQMKDIAGQLLIDLGYEKDLNW
jgi:hypothetical protein